MGRLPCTRLHPPGAEEANHASSHRFVRRIGSDKRARMLGRTDPPILNGSGVISTRNWLAVNHFAHVLRVFRGWANHPRRHQRRVHSLFRREPVDLR